MKENNITIRRASIKDAEALLNIYTPYVEKTAITFEYDIPSVEEFAGRIQNTLEKYPYLVAECGESILGYAYAGCFKARAAYDWSVETSIYVAWEERGRGIGKLLYEALEKELSYMHIINVNACIASPIVADETLDEASIHFHTHMGYDMVGTFHQCGYKFGRWYDMVWMEKMLGDHPEEPLPVIPYSQMENAAY